MRCTGGGHEGVPIEWMLDGVVLRDDDQGGKGLVEYTRRSIGEVENTEKDVVVVGKKHPSRGAKTLGQQQPPCQSIYSLQHCQAGSRSFVASCHVQNLDFD